MAAAVVALALVHGVARAGRNEFSFVFESGYGERVDSRRGLVTKDLVSRPDTTIALRFTPSELRALERTFRSLRVLAIAAPHPPYKLNVMEVPSTTWRFDVHMDGRARQFEWDSRFGEEGPEWSHLWAAIDSVRAVVERRAEYRRLPQPAGGYL